MPANENWLSEESKFGSFPPCPLQWNYLHYYFNTMVDVRNVTIKCNCCSHEHDWFLPKSALHKPLKLLPEDFKFQKTFTVSKIIRTKFKLTQDLNVWQTKTTEYTDFHQPGDY